MPTFLTELLSQVKAIWSKLDGGQRMIIVSVGLGAAAFLIGVMMYTGQPDYVHLAQFKDSSQLAEMEAALGNLDYQADDRSIKIEVSQKKQARQALADSGLLPSDGKEDAILGMASGMTEREAIAWRRLEKDAGRAIAELTGVREARVVGREIKRRIKWGGEEGVRSRATVTVRLSREEGWQRTAQAAIGIVSAKLGIRNEDVTVVNSVTHQIFRSDEMGAPSSGDFWQQQQQLGQDLELQAQMLLEEAYPGKTRVRVSVELKPDWKTTVMPVAMATPLVLKKEKTKDKSGGSTTGGDPSLPSKTGPGAGPPVLASRGGGTERNKETSSTEYSEQTGTERSGLLAPEMARMTVALVLDPSIFGAVDGTPLDEEAPEVKTKKEKIENLVMGAIGFDLAKRTGDFQTLIAKIVLPEDSGEEASGPGVMDLAREYTSMIGPILALILVLFFLKGMLKKADLKSIRTGAQEEDLEEIPEEDLTPDEQTKRMRREIEKAIADDPAAVTRLLETWLSEQPA